MLDLLIRNGRIIDGSGNPWYAGDVGIEGQRIAAVGHLEGAEGTQVLDARDKVVCPGFIDMHSHADGALLVDPVLEPAIRQGVTTEVIAQDGMSFAPVSERNRETMRWRLAGVGDMERIPWDWHSVDQFLSRLEGNIGVNAAFLVPLANLYVDAVGWDYQTPTESQLADMRRLAVRVMEEGAFGLSSGLSYPPQHCFRTEDVVELCREIAARGGIYVTHVRYGLGDGFLDPWREAIEIGERAQIPVHLSHVSIRTRNSGQAPELLGLFDDARCRGVDLTIESYCYPAGAGWLTAFMPAYFFDGGPAAAMERLRDPDMQQALIRYLNFGNKAFRSGLSWDDVFITGVSLEKNKMCEGKSVGELSDLSGQDPGTFVCSLLFEERLKVGHKFMYGLERDVRDVMQYPAHMVGSDSIFYGGSPHPRAYGTFPRYLGTYSRELGLLRLEEAVRKMTSFPAQRLGLQDRGLLKPGMAADMVIFDPNTVIDRATWEDPCQFPVGIEQVVVNGQVAVRDGQLTGALAGQVLRRSTG